eukprot:PhF_6_TR33880/c0_g1_i1/m.49719
MQKSRDEVRRLSASVGCLQNSVTATHDRALEAQSKATAILSQWKAFQVHVFEQQMEALDSLREEGVLNRSNDKVSSIVHCTMFPWSELNDGWCLTHIPHNSFSSSIELRHKRSSTIEDSGVQLWLGGLLLCDFVSLKLQSDWLVVEPSCSSPGRINIVEIGCGVGLTGIILARTFAAIHQLTNCALQLNVYETDYDRTTRKNCLHNLHRNAVPAMDEDEEKELGTTAMTSGCFVYVEHLDWTCPESYLWNRFPHQFRETTSRNILLAGDVTYDDDMKSDVTATIQSFLKDVPNAEVWIAMEVREAVVGNAATPKDEGLVSCLENHGLRVMEMVVDLSVIPNVLPYERVPALQIRR